MGFIYDLHKELIKDIIGQYIFYYPVDEERTKVHPVYQEATKKFFKKPIKIDCLAGNIEKESVADVFGSQQDATLTILVQSRDLIDKGITISEGDFFVYGASSFEIVSYVRTGDIYRQEEYENAYKIVAKTVSVDVFDPNEVFPPSDDHKDFLDSGVEKTWSQQRGLPMTPDGKETNDVRQVRERLKDDMAPIALGEGPREIVLDKENPEAGNQFEHDTTGFFYSDD